MGTGSAQRNSTEDPVSFIPSSNTRQCEDIKEGTILVGKVHKTLQSNNLIDEPCPRLRTNEPLEIGVYQKSQHRTKLIEGLFNNWE